MSSRRYELPPTVLMMTIVLGCDWQTLGSIKGLRRIGLGSEAKVGASEILFKVVDVEEDDVEVVEDAVDEVDIFVVMLEVDAREDDFFEGVVTIFKTDFVSSRLTRDSDFLAFFSILSRISSQGS